MRKIDTTSGTNLYIKVGMSWRIALGRKIDMTLGINMRKKIAMVIDTTSGIGVWRGLGMTWGINLGKGIDMRKMLNVSEWVVSACGNACSEAQRGRQMWGLGGRANQQEDAVRGNQWGASMEGRVDVRWLARAVADAADVSEKALIGVTRDVPHAGRGAEPRGKLRGSIVAKPRCCSARAELLACDDGDVFEH